MWKSLNKYHKVSGMSKMSKNRWDTSPEENPPLRRWEEEGDDDLWNPDKLFLCPYDPNHKIRACRLPYHLIKCKKNHPELAQQLLACPYNARHLMRKHELSNHISTCVNRCSLDTDYVVTDETQRKFQVPVSTWSIPACSEDWDKEEEESGTPATPFVWGISTSLHIQNSAEPATTISLTPGVRAPRVLPWKSGV